MECNISPLLVVCLLFSFSAYAMEMAEPAIVTEAFVPAAVLMKKEAPGVTGHIGRGLTCVCSHCLHAGDTMRHCTGWELPMAVACQGCSYCSAQLAFWDLLRRQGDHHIAGSMTGLAGIGAISAGASACLAVMALSLDRLHKRQAMDPAEQHAKAE